MATPEAVLTYRKLLRPDAAALRAHLTRLPAEDLRARFLGVADRKVAQRHVAGIDWDRVVLVGGWRGETLRAVGELHRGPGAPEAEAAITVEPAWQNRGVGGELLRRLVTAARNRGVRRVRLFCLADNARIRRIAARLGGALVEDGGQADATLEPLPATYATLLAESVEDWETLLARLARITIPVGPAPPPALRRAA